MKENDNEIKALIEKYKRIENIVDERLSKILSDNL